MSQQFEYKGYLGSAEVDIESGMLAGKLLFIRDTITYSANTIAKLRRAFEEAVEDYLRTCQEVGDKPDEPLKGSFNVRVGPERHRAIAVKARETGAGLNEFVCLALDTYLQDVRPRKLEVKLVQVSEVKTVFSGSPSQLTAVTSGPANWTQSHERSKKH